MKNTVVLSILLLGCVTLCYGTSQPMIENTKAEECIDGVCKSICSWEGAKIAEGETLNQPGKCRLLHCSDDGNFRILITPCPFDITGQFKWVENDDSKLYPECCGKKVSLT